MVVARISDALKPLIACLWIAGLYLFPLKAKSKVKIAAKAFCNVLFLGAMLYSGVYGFVYWCFFIWGGLFSNRPVIAFFYDLTYSLSILYASVLTCVLTPTHCRKLLAKLDDYYERYDNRKNLPRLRVIIMLIFIVTNFVIIPFNVYSLIKMDFGSDLPHVMEFMEAIPLRCIVLYYFLMSLLYAIIAYCIICFLLLSSANCLMKDLKSHGSRELESSPALLEQIRLRHDKLCQIIAKANVVVGHILAAHYFGSILCTLFLIHGFVYGTLTLPQLQMRGNQLGFTVSILLIMTLTGVCLNKKMHKPADYLHGLNIDKMPGKGPEIVSAFLSRLQGKPIGFHVYHLFTIDYSTVITVCGTIVTYALVIVQFQPGSEGGGSMVTFSETPSHTNLTPSTVPPQNHSPAVNDSLM